MVQYNVIIKVFGLRKQDVGDRDIATFETKVESILLSNQPIWFTFVQDEIITLGGPILIEVKFKNGKRPGKDLESLLIKASSESFLGRQEEAIVDFL